MISPGQTVGDIIHATDLFTTFAHLGGATANVPTDRIIDGVELVLGWVGVEFDQAD